ncbi:restriction endonuclease subunit S [Streptococcus salivarius]
MTNSKHVPKRRFKEFELDDEWEQLKLGDHANILTGGTPNTSISSYWEPKEIPWMSSGEVNRKRLDKTDNMISNDGIRNSSARWVKKHSILIALAGQGKTRGMVAVNNIPLTTNQSVAAIEPDKTLNYEFVFQNLSKRYDELRLISSGDGSRGGLNKQIVSDISIACPNVNEQELIGNFLADFDSLITMNQHKLDKLKNLKKAYLAELFPAEGERVPKRRFPGFEGEWEEKKLGEMSNITAGGDVDKDKLLTKGNYPVLANAHTNEGIIGYYEENYQIEAPAVTVTGRGDIGFAKARKENFTPVVRLLSIKSKHNVDFLAEAINQNKVIFESTGVPQLTIPKLSNYKIYFPSEVDEENSIGNFLVSLDSLITLQQHKLDKLNDLKKAYLNELFV